MATTLRIYRVDEKADGKIIASLLVRAPNVAQAVRHVAKRFSAEVATQDDLVQLCAKGTAVIDAINGGEDASE
jgi:hypothetical protein